MATSDIKILEGRLLTRDSAVTGSTVTKCALRLQQLFATLQSPDIKSDAGPNINDATAAALEAFSRDVLLYKVEMGKFEQSFQMLDEEAVEYDSLEAKIESNIEETTQSIVTLTQELVQQKKLKQHREECEALSRIVNLVPSTRKIIAASDVVNEEIYRLEEQLASIESVEKLRNRQVNLLLQSISDLTQSLEEEEALQKQLQLLQQSVDNQTQEDEEANEDNDEDVDGDDESRDKRSVRGNTKRKKPSGDGDDLEEDTEGTASEERVQVEGKESASQDSNENVKKQKTSPGAVEEVEEGEAVEQNVASTAGSTSSAVRMNGSGSPVAMSVKEKLLQQQAKRAQKKLEKEMREKEEEERQRQGTASTSSTTAETEEGEEDEGSMDTSA